MQIRVSGTPRQMGEQHGELLKHEIHDLLDAMYHHVLYGQPRMVGWGIRRAVRTVTRIMEPHIPRRYREEMAAVARAADVLYRDVLLLNCFDDVLANLRLLSSLMARLGCSTFAVLPERTEEGELICGRNLDYFIESAAGEDVWAATNYMKEHLAIIEFAPADRTGFVAVGWPGFVATVTGMSQRGVVVGSLTVATLRSLLFATPAPFLYRAIMEEAETLDDAVRILRRARRTQGNNVLLGSGREGSAAVVEYTPWRLAVRHPENGAVVATNHFEHPNMLRQGELPHRSSSDRFTRLQELCSPTREMPVSAEEAGRFLTDSERRSPDANEYCSVYNPCTVYSTVFEPARGRLWVRPADRPDRTFEEITVSA